MENAHQNIELNNTSFERDLEQITALFDSLSQNPRLAPPPPAIIEKIHHEAHLHSLRLRFRHRMRQWVRITTAAAALLLLLAGGMRFNSVQQSNRRIEVINQLSIVCDTELLKDASLETSNAALANLLMEMQGLDAETYFAFN
ncbi:MAG: hypothetical protein PHO37_09705 [Kiritimatiellae bacterium]|nr:hypothetical protein [Kiritimatiellia bacterium]